jgi:hypothetical protein
MGSKPAQHSATRRKLPFVVCNRMRYPMVARGRVKNGVVVLAEGVRLPEGQEVTVVTRGAAPATRPMQSSPAHHLLDIPTASLGPVLRPLSADDDLLEEMLAEIS